jgi:hypothetical protein
MSYDTLCRYRISPIFVVQHFQMFYILHNCTYRINPIFLYNTFRCRMIQFAHTESVLFELYGTFRCRTYDTLCPYRISPIFCHATLSYFCATHFSVISVGLCKYPITYVCSTRSSWTRCSPGPSVGRTCVPFASGWWSGGRVSPVHKMEELEIYRETQEPILRSWVTYVQRHQRVVF